MAQDNDRPYRPFVTFVAWMRWNTRRERRRVLRMRRDERLEYKDVTDELLEGLPCAVCGRGPCVTDHCHFTGIVRGSLCFSCNTREGTGSGPAVWDLSSGVRVYVDYRGRVPELREVRAQSAARERKSWLDNVTDDIGL